MIEPEAVWAKRKRIGVFFDGAYAERIRECEGWGKRFYRQLIPVLHRNAAEWLGVEPDQCAVVTMQWFRGMFTVNQQNRREYDSRGRLRLHEFECELCEQLCLAAIDVYRRPMQEVEHKFKEKGIDQLLQARTLHAIEVEDLDAIVLIAGDSDHITLFEEANRRGARTILVWYEFEDANAKSSYRLVQRADCSLRLDFDDMRPHLHAERKTPAERGTRREAEAEVRVPVPGMPTRI